MNILPHKSWHVRTKKNIARVRADEAKAAEEEKEKQRRIDLAEREARIDILRKRAAAASSSSPAIESTASDDDHNTNEPSHVNFFKDLEEGKTDGVNRPNADYLKEKKEEQEKYEKQIGYLTYLGQDTNEALRKKDWYEKLPDRGNSATDDNVRTEVELKRKSYHDPLNIIRKVMGPTEAKDTGSQFTKKSNYTSMLKDIGLIEKEIEKSRKKKSKRKKSKKSKKSRKRRHSSSTSSPDSDDEDLQKLKKRKIEILRQERIKREAAEKQKADLLLAKVRGDPVPFTKPKEPERPVVRQKYNSQFNPELARQNYED